MATILPVSTFQFLQAMVDESPNKHLSLDLAQKYHVIFFKSALKLTKIGTLVATTRVPRISNGLGYSSCGGEMAGFFRFISKTV
jgi:hypothetical protein